MCGTNQSNATYSSLTSSLVEAPPAIADVVYTIAVTRLLQSTAEGTYYIYTYVATVSFSKRRHRAMGTVSILWLECYN